VNYSKSVLSHHAEVVEIDSRLRTITRGLNNEILNGFGSLSNENLATIVEYISAMITETNPSDNYRKDNIRSICLFSRYNKNKPFRSITRDEVISFLNSRRKPESSDPLHKWIGTYNLYRIYFIRFFKWLYASNNEQSKRPKPKVVNNIPALKRKEKSIYKPSDLWTEASTNHLIYGLRQTTLSSSDTVQVKEIGAFMQCLGILVAGRMSFLDFE
jgi:hypothetical protein